VSRRFVDVYGSLFLAPFWFAVPTGRRGWVPGRCWQKEVSVGGDEELP
jgi:hypothetical protein